MARSRHGAPSSTSSVACTRRLRSAPTCRSSCAASRRSSRAGERLTPLKGVHGHPGILLVTPSIAVRTPDVFSVFDGIRGSGDGSIRMSSEHLAQELGQRLVRDGPDRPSRGPRLSQRPAAGRAPRGARARRREARAHADADAGRRAERVRADPVDALSFARGGQAAAEVAEAAVAAGTIPSHSATDRLRSSPRPSGPDTRSPPHDPPGRLDQRRARRHRPV